MSIEQITSKILDEATEVKKEALKEAKIQCDEILREAKGQAAEIVKDMEGKGQSEKQLIVERRKSVAYIDSRKVLLNKKQEVITQCFDEAVDKIIGMDKSAYTDLLVALGKASGLESGVLQFNKKEAKEFGPKVAKALGDFKVSDECGNMKGGYIIQSGQTYVDNTIESLVTENKTELSATVSEMLFAEKK